MTTRGGGTFIGRGGMGRAGRIRPLKNHTMPMTDHAGRPALIVFQGLASLPLLPPLYSYSVYFTHPAASPATVDAAALADLIYGRRRAYFRLELYCLPAGSHDDCIAHFLAEKAARGDYMPQVEAAGALPSDEEGDIEAAEGVDGGVGAGTARSGALPGLVPSYRNDNTESYHAVLYVIDGPQCPVAGQQARRIHFDSVSQAEWDAVMRAWGEPEEKVKPIFVGDEESLEQMGSRMFLEAFPKTENVTNEPWQKAVNHSWVSW